MSTTRNKHGPDPNEGGQRRHFGRRAATPRREEGDPSLTFVYGNASGQEGGSPSDTGLPESMGNQTLGMTSNHDVLADYEVEAGGYFSRVGLTPGRSPRRRRPEGATSPRHAVGPVEPAYGRRRRQRRYCPCGGTRTLSWAEGRSSRADGHP